LPACLRLNHAPPTPSRCYGAQKIIFKNLRKKVRFNSLITRSFITANNMQNIVNREQWVFTFPSAHPILKAFYFFTFQKWCLHLAVLLHKGKNNKSDTIKETNCATFSIASLTAFQFVFCQIKREKSWSFFFRFSSKTQAGEISSAIIICCQNHHQKRISEKSLNLSKQLALLHIHTEKVGKTDERKDARKRKRYLFSISIYVYI